MRSSTASIVWADAAVGLVGDLVEQVEQLAEPPAPCRRRPGRGLAQRLGEREPGALGVGRELGDRGVADAPLGRVHDPLGRYCVVGVRERPQVRERVLDLAAVVELHAAETR